MGKVAMRMQYVMIVTLGTVPWLNLEFVQAERDAASHRVPDRFIPIDTTRLLGSPDPLPMEAERVFPKLKFERPVELTFADDGTDRLFVVEQAGIVRVFPNAADASEAKVFLDLRDVVLRAGNEEGLLGLAFHPDYAENGKFYVYYSTEPRSSVVAAFRVSPDDADRALRESEERLLQIDQPFENHNGGSLKFGPDGYLYIGLGDGGLRDDPHDNAQSLGSLLGKILRIDVDDRDEGLAYSIPRDNPFVDRPDARGEIWAYGFRNIWRLGFDRKSGDLWAADVGQDRFEEVNRIERGGNYGWNIREGMHDFQPNTPAKPAELIEPLAEYFRGEGQSITGGFVYQGDRLPDLRGRYVYGDYLSGNVWALKLDEHKRVEKLQKAAATGLQIAAFGEDRAGEMYLCAFDGGIYRMRNRDGDLQAEAKVFPRKLSETGLFQSVAKNEPAEELIPYELNVPFWSDYAVKDRYLALPKAKSVEFRETESWRFPVGTVLVKTFWMHFDRAEMKDARRLETRLLVHGNDGWAGYTYVYDDDEQEAHLLDDSQTDTLTIKTEDGVIRQSYYFPSRTDCMACHTRQHGFVLGLKTPQMNRMQNYRGVAENLLTMLDRLEVFTRPLDDEPDALQRFPDWGFGNLIRSDENDDAAEHDSGVGPDSSALPELPEGDAAALARAWLDVNCAMCHLPDGVAPGKRDLRYDVSLEKMNVVDKPISQLRRRPKEVRIIAPGDPLRSELLQRVSVRGPYQMPPLATHYVEPRAYEILRRWIAEMEPSER